MSALHALIAGFVKRLLGSRMAWLRSIEVRLGGSFGGEDEEFDLDVRADVVV
jgi:hypothetical protein